MDPEFVDTKKSNSRSHSVLPPKSSVRSLKRLQHRQLDPASKIIGAKVIYKKVVPLHQNDELTHQFINEAFLKAR